MGAPVVPALRPGAVVVAVELLNLLQTGWGAVNFKHCSAVLWLDEQIIRGDTEEHRGFERLAQVNGVQLVDVKPALL
jgi:hypothetical protein